MECNYVIRCASCGMDTVCEGHADYRAGADAMDGYHGAGRVFAEMKVGKDWVECSIKHSTRGDVVVCHPQILAGNARSRPMASPHRSRRILAFLTRAAEAVAEVVNSAKKS